MQIRFIVVISRVNFQTIFIFFSNSAVAFTIIALLSPYCCEIIPRHISMPALHAGCIPCSWQLHFQSNILALLLQRGHTTCKSFYLSIVLSPQPWWIQFLSYRSRQWITGQLTLSTCMLVLSIIKLICTIK